MNEVKSPKKPLIYYYMIVVLLVLLFNLLAMPWLAEHQIKEVDYNTFVSMTEKNEIGQVEIQQQSNRILFTSTDGKTIYKTAIVPDDGLVQRLLDADISCLTTGGIHAYAHLAEVFQKLVCTVDDGRYNLSRNEHLVSADSARNENVIHSSYAEQVVGIHHDGVLCYTFPYAQIASLFPVHICK